MPDQVPPDDEKVRPRSTAAVRGAHELRTKWTTPSNKTRGAHQKYTLTCLKPVISVFSDGAQVD